MFNFKVKKIHQGVAYIEMERCNFKKTYCLREGDVVINDEIYRKCNFCGRDFNEEEHFKTMTEQAPSRDEVYIKMAGTKHCGLYCGWLDDKNMIPILEKDHHRVDKMKDDVAKRVIKYLKINKLK